MKEQIAYSIYRTWQLQQTPTVFYNDDAGAQVVYSLPTPISYIKSSDELPVFYSEIANQAGSDSLETIPRSESEMQTDVGYLCEGDNPGTQQWVLGSYVEDARNWQYKIKHFDDCTMPVSGNYTGNLSRTTEVVTMPNDFIEFTTWDLDIVFSGSDIPDELKHYAFPSKESSQHSLLFEYKHPHHFVMIGNYTYSDSNLPFTVSANIDSALMGKLSNVLMDYDINEDEFGGIAQGQMSFYKDGQPWFMLNFNRSQIQIEYESETWKTDGSLLEGLYYSFMHK